LLGIEVATATNGPAHVGSKKKTRGQHPLNHRNATKEENTEKGKGKTTNFRLHPMPNPIPIKKNIRAPRERVRKSKKTRRVKLVNMVQGGGYLHKSKKGAT